MNLASRSYYYKPKSNAAGRAQTDAELRDQIERIQGEFPGYGYRRLGKQLRREGIRVNDKRIRRVQRKYQLYPVRWHSLRSPLPIPSMGTRFIRICWRDWC
jgi:hypothetical protein